MEGFELGQGHQGQTTEQLGLPNSHSESIGQRKAFATSTVVILRTARAF